MLIPLSVLSKDWEAGISRNLTEKQQAIYHERTKKARLAWEEAQRSHKHDKGLSWEQNNHEMSCRYLAYRQALWAMYMQIRTKG